MKITIFNKLRKFESYMITAVRANYIRSLTVKQVEELSEIGNELGMPYVHNGCPKCMLSYMQKVGKLYFEQKEKLDNNKKIKNNVKDKG